MTRLSGNGSGLLLFIMCDSCDVCAGVLHDDQHLAPGHGFLKCLELWSRSAVRNQSPGYLAFTKISLQIARDIRDKLLWDSVIR